MNPRLERTELSEVGCWFVPAPSDTGTWTLFTCNGQGYESVFEGIHIVPPRTGSSDSTAFLNGRRFQRVGGMWHEEVRDTLAVIRHDAIVVKPREGVSEEEIAELNAGLAATEINKNLLGFRDLRLNPGSDPIRAVESYLNDSRVRYAETVPTGRFESNDTYYPSQWWIEGQNGQDTDVSDAWVFETGTDTTLIAIIDTGVDFGHEDLKGNRWTNPDDWWDGQDNDGNGKTDDTHGWDFRQGDRWCMRGKHGTAVAGLAVPVTNNSKGIGGVAGGYEGRCGQDHVDTGVSFMALGIGDDSDTDVILAEYTDDAILYAADHGARAINMSFTLDTEHGRTYIDQAIDHAYHVRGCLLAAATGNENENNPRYPASHAKVIAVGAVDEQGRVWHYSNRNPEVVAPAGGSDCVFPPLKPLPSGRQTAPATCGYTLISTLGTLL